MSELSPGAQAVFDATCREIDYVPERHVRWAAIAALRAAADQVVPEPNDLDKEILSLAAIRRRMFIRDRFLAIATELEAYQ